MAGSTRRKAALGALAVVLAVSLGVVGMWALQRRLIYFPDQAAANFELLGPGWEQIECETADGLTLQAWYRAPDNDRPVVIVFNGNGGDRGGRIPLGAGFAQQGFGVLLADYRGYGGNPGHPTESGLAADARAFAGVVAERAPDAPVIYFGESLGAAVAVELAVAEPPAALVLRSPFTSLADVGRVHYPWLPISALLKDEYPSIERIGSAHVPTLVIAGDGDSIVPIDQSRALFSAAPGPKRFHVVAGADHNDPALASGREMIATISEFLTNVAGL